MSSIFAELRTTLGDPTALLTASSSTPEQWETANYRWSANTEREPAVVAYPATAEDVANILQWAKNNAFPIAVKCGGNDNLSASSVKDGLVIDMRRINQVKLADDKKSISVGGGCLWSEVYPVCDEAKVSVVGGGSHQVGVGGYLTQAGWSWLVGLYGYACDNILEATVVLPNGKVVRCSEAQEPDLFWAIRGGGANFGIVTEFVLKTHPHVGGHLAGTLHYEGKDLLSVVTVVKKFLEVREPFQSIYLGFDMAPNGEPEVFVLLWVKAESATAAKQHPVMRPFWTEINPVADHTVFCTTHVETSHIGDAAEQASPRRIDGRGWNFEVRTFLLPNFVEDLWNKFVKVVSTPDFSHSLFFLECHDLRKAASKSLDSAAFPGGGRKPHIGLLAGLKYSDPANDVRADEMLRDILGYVRDAAKRADHVLLGTPSFLCHGDEPLEDVWLSNLPKLKACKARYDPDCLLRSGFLIPPA